MTLNGEPFPTHYIQTSRENYSKDVTIEGSEYKIHIWDVPYEEYERLRPFSYSVASEVALTFLLNIKRSFVELLEKFHEEANKYCPNIPLVLIGLCLDERQPDNADHVFDEEAKKLATEWNKYEYIPCSARTGENDDKIFPTLLQVVASQNYSCFIE